MSLFILTSGFLADTCWGDSIYKIYETATTYGAAKAQCESDGTHLAIPKSEAENHFIASLIPNEDIWIGINDIEEEGTYVTVDGSAISYTNWKSGQPDNTIKVLLKGTPEGTPNDEDGIHISYQDKKWNDNPVNYLHKFVCSKSISN